MRGIQTLAIRKVGITTLRLAITQAHQTPFIRQVQFIPQTLFILIQVIPAIQRAQPIGPSIAAHVIIRHLAITALLLILVFRSIWAIEVLTIAGSPVSDSIIAGSRALASQTVDSRTVDSQTVVLTIIDAISDGMYTVEDTNLTNPKIKFRTSLITSGVFYFRIKHFNLI